MDTDEKRGLSREEVENRIREGRRNVMPKAKEGGVGEILCRNILTLFNLINVILAVLLLLVGSYRNMLFMGVVISNALIGTIQELRAKKTHDRLQLLSLGKVKTLRDGVPMELSPDELVQDDVVLLSRGDQIPADAQVLEGTAHVDESILTGESVPTSKGVGDTLFSGSYLVEGSLTARLTSVGSESYMGRLQMSARKVKRASSVLMGDMNRIIRYVSMALLPLGLLLYWKQTAAMELTHADALVKTVASVIGMIPEGLILLTSVSLADGVVTLGRKKTLGNEQYGIESLARTDTLCMDKTGTLTSGQMSFHACTPAPGVGEEEIRECTSALLSVLGNDSPTIAALAEAYPKHTEEKALEIIAFSSARKWSLARFDGLGSVVLGAPERLLQGEELGKAQELAATGLRVVALMRSEEAPSLVDGETSLPDKLQFLALFSMEDALRPKVKETVRYFGEQGVTLKVLSGDSPLTVSCVAKSAGLPNAEALIDLSAVEGEKDYAALSREYTIFGRVSPEDKRELIRAMQEDGHSVAMMGDGVNDIPALKTANCSLAMAGGSDAACRVAQMTLLGGGFDAMPQILLEGRRVINNITRASALFLVKNIYSILISLLLLGLPFIYPFAPIQLTLISSLTVGAPSLVLALQPSSERVKGNFLRNIITRALPGGICIALQVLVVLCLQNALGYDDGTVSTLCTLLAGGSSVFVLLLTCMPLNWLRGGIVLLVAGLFTVCALFFPQVFYLTAITGSQWWVLTILGALGLPLQILLGKAIGRFHQGEAEQKAQA
ncbi:MAG: HAD-IC family P-type ATPase [Eubacteriales bacterium]|nr:HAD-IC family P-type ATPase [Eubacteriales bacterium]